mgnify:CR=1 FL=1
MLSFRDGDGRGAEGIIAYERIPKATSFGEKAMTETLKTSKSWRNKQNLNHNFVSHSPGRSAVFSPRCVELSKALPGSTWSAPHDLGSETFQDFLLTFRDTLETKQDGSHEPECIHVLGLRIQTSAIGKQTFFCMHRALIPSQRRRLSNSSQRDN